MLNISKELRNMPTQTRQQVADEINRIESQGATEDQILAVIAKAGYKDTDFNVDMDGKTRPTNIGSGFSGNSSAAELAAVKKFDAEVDKESNYYESIVATSKTVPKPTTTETTTSIQTVTGGGTATRYSTPAVDTPASTALDNAGTSQYKLGQAYAANPNTKVGQATLQRSLNEGVITQEQYDSLKNATPEQRAANKEKATALFSQSENSFADSAQAKAPGSASLQIEPSANSSKISVQYQQTVGSSSTILPNSSTGKGTTENIDGQTYDVEKSSDGTTTSYTPISSPAGTNAKIVVNTENTTSAPANTSTYYENNGTTGNEIPATQQPGQALIDPNFVGPQQKLTEQGIPAGSEMGVAFDDDGNVKPGWALDPSGQFYVQTDPGYIDPKTAAQAVNDREAFQNSQAFDANGNLNPGYTYDEFGTPVRAGDASGSKPEVPVSTQQFDDGSKLETYADGSTVSTDSEGNITFNSATQPEVQKNVTDESTPTDHGPAYDDEGNLMPGWTLDEENNPVWVGGGFVEQKTVDSAAESRSANSANHGPPYDDDGNLMPGWSLDENGDPVWVGGDFVEPATAKSAAESRAAVASNHTGALNDAATSNAKAANKATPAEPDDWRVRLSLAPNSNYLYRTAKSGDILFPLNGTNGVLFPYTPQIQTSYKANYDPGELTHSNYKMYFYKNSSVDDVTITADFTAQDTAEANYMLAVIHFFKSATKMFYGKDNSPRAGTPPPLLYLTGFGAYQFDRHPLLLTNFTYNLPNDVDYIRAGSTKTWGGTNIAQLGNNKVNSAASTPLDRLKANFTKIAPGGTCPAPTFASSLSNADSTYVPTKIQIQLSLVPVVTRKDISDNFSLEKYATGSLSRGSRRSGGGIW
jgi:hypothetical protein